MENYKNLLSPIKVGTRKLKNRVICAPRGGVFHGDPNQTDVEPGLLMEIDLKCSGGLAEFIVGETPVSMAGGRSDEVFWDYTDLSEGNLYMFKKCADRIHSYGTTAVIELSHAGAVRRSSSPKSPAYGPMTCVNSMGAKVTGMTEEIIRKTCEEYATCAYFMQKAGYDGACVHCGHGWLPHQFLSTRWNQRTDRFGGSIENRSRFSVMMLDAIREKCGPDFMLECRITGDEHQTDGYSADEIVEYCRQIQDHCDMIHVSAGLYDKPMETWMMSTLYEDHGCNVPMAEKIKKAVSVPVAVVGGINDPDMAEELISDGKCDLVCIGRQTTADPDWVKKTQEGKVEQIRKCIRCMRCFPGPFEEAMAELNGQFPRGCTVSPYELHGTRVEPADVKKKVLIAGGGVAGMQAAITASQRGHQVTLVEKSDRLGGILNFAEHDKDKYDLKRLVLSMEAELKESDVMICLNREAETVQMQEFEYVILAVGSSPFVPLIPGMEYTIPAMDAYNPETYMGNQIIILGGGLVGCETAVHLSKQGKKVVLVEMRSELAPDAYRLHKHKLRQLIAEDDNIEVLLNTKCLSVSEDSVKLEQDGKEIVLGAQSVVAALGMKANPSDVLEQIAQKTGVPCVKIGDCVRARKIFDAIEEGYTAAVNL